MKEALSFGNHKGAVRNLILPKNWIEKDIVHGYGLVLPLSKIDEIPGVLLAPTLNDKVDSASNISRDWGGAKGQSKLPLNSTLVYYIFHSYSFLCLTPVVFYG